MLDAHIIDAIRKEELEREREYERRRIWLELPLIRPEERAPRGEERAEDDEPYFVPFRPEMPIRSPRGEDAA